MRNDDKTVLTLPEVVALTTLSKPTIYTYVRDGIFPRQVRSGPNWVVWRRAEVQSWLEERAASREAA
ncbi:helix-turn-helix transcriptional regulator [Sphingomonas faeni]|uniref:helix-turn-helix transcriptional regulator n=1 Tax=Sphingomonas faeni TaxID=185950 RepID=UPI0027853FC3|nr:AlpA family phage regulatory protein [Sphingomonas faeni]MDQ0839518.1 prophage regulatory protein [Sphingomonas faeni]